MFYYMNCKFMIGCCCFHWPLKIFQLSLMGRARSVFFTCSLTFGLEGSLHAKKWPSNFGQKKYMKSEVRLRKSEVRLKSTSSFQCKSITSWTPLIKLDVLNHINPLVFIYSLSQGQKWPLKFPIFIYFSNIQIYELIMAFLQGPFSPLFVHQCAKLRPYLESSCNFA